MKVLIGCLNEIQKIQRSFIWGDNDNKRHTHMVGWNIMTLSKQHGCMGFKNLQMMNEACLIKMNWALVKG
jgi:hypothetical protein